jgi:hypothetical protein
MYLALGDPLQKRNFYRAGWLRFKDDADMAYIMAELSEKKVLKYFELFVNPRLNHIYRLRDLNCMLSTIFVLSSTVFVIRRKLRVSLKG